jgi:hypothetical protein
MTETPNIVRGVVALECSPYDPAALNAAIEAVRAAQLAQYPGGRWEATHWPEGVPNRPEVEGEDPPPPTPNVLTFAIYTAGGGPVE